MTEQPPTAPDPTALREAVTRKAALKALYDHIGEALAVAGTDVQYLLNQQYKATGTTKVDALLPDGTQVGSVTRKGGEKAAVVTDEEAFRAWVRDAYPSEHVVDVIPVHIVAKVQPGFVAKVLAEATAAGVARYVDPATAEVHDVPGVEIKPSRAASHQLNYRRATKADSRTGRDLVAQAWREGALAAHVLPALAPATPTTPPAEAEAVEDAPAA
ncbi:hypothetical protein OG864_29870 [Streptomyces sp. NBC_00124]|uniref:hypothetical protein n=1 Tax=Streptomyces sp. NBC_00124 TaxID=2975662 RepID=UPI00225026E8|nr:hypothetical protein [Streptomyces sp. NBC_00124]MCX5362910.1 hypothetical protein [Streptomyces sp. NBC_00124]